jgi:hypothetical protein
LSRTSRIVMVMLVALAAFFGLAELRYAGRAPVKLPAANCDAGLWQHVYEKDRLQVVEPCTAVVGKVVSLHPSSDGDLHISLDPDDSSVLNLVNVVHGRRKLVVEVICEHPPSDAEAQSACSDFRSSVTIPGVGDRVRITGAYVTDHDNGWREIHPVTRIEVLR